VGLLGLFRLFTTPQADGNEDTEMDFSEFCEALCGSVQPPFTARFESICCNSTSSLSQDCVCAGCACYKSLDPYMSLEMRLEQLLNKSILYLPTSTSSDTLPRNPLNSEPRADSWTRSL
jgi:hypothetical protein